MSYVSGIPTCGEKQLSAYETLVNKLATQNDTLGLLVARAENISHKLSNPDPSPIDPNGGEVISSPTQFSTGLLMDLYKQIENNDRMLMNLGAHLNRISSLLL